MRVRRFVGDNVAEAMAKVKKELGSDAVILQTRQFREGGFFGLFGKVKVEITAAIDEQQPKIPKIPPQMTPYYTANSQDSGLSAMNTQGLLTIPDRSASGTEKRDNLTKENLIYKEAIINKEKNINKREEEGDSEVNNSPLQKELENMRRMLEQMNMQMAAISSDRKEWPPALVKWADDLLMKGIDSQIINRFIQEIRRQIPAEEWENESLIKTFIKNQVVQMCANSSAAIQPQTGKTVVVALVGPTGVGKTTTIGKLAATFGIIDKRKVAMITADTYRVAAVEQLKTFGEIIGVPVDVVMTPSALRESIERHKDKELIFIDTAGRSPNHNFHMSELQAFLANAKADFTILVMSATTQTADQYKLLDRFGGMVSHLLFTKLDETFCKGSLLNIIERTNLPVTYLTTGQSVPDDIEAATPERLAGYILGDDYNV